jgi:biopolymer transport protein ExbB
LEFSLLEALKQGSASMWVILACSVIALAVAVERAIALWGFTARARALADAVTRAVYRGDLDDGRAQCERSGSPAADVFLAALVAAGPARPGARSAPPTPEKLAAAVERERQQVNLKLRRNLWILGTVGATAPFVGLFGTVWGIMNSFIGISRSQTTNLAVVAPGIAEALLATALGLFAAIPAVILFNVLTRGIADHRGTLDELSTEILRLAGRDLDRGDIGRAVPHAARSR